MTRKPPSLAVLVAITMLNPLALNILQPALPDLARALATDYGTIQLTLSLYLVASAFAQIAIGPVSDRYGRRPVALAGALVFVIGSAACWAATSVVLLVIGRIVQAVGGIAGFVLARAVLRDLHERDTAASKLGYVTMSMVVVPMMAPLIGGWISEHWGYTSIFVFCAAIGVATLIYALIDLSETRRRPEIPGNVSVLGAYRALATSRAFLAHTVTMGFSSATFFTFLAAMPYVVIELQGSSPAEYGLWWMTASIAFMGGNFIAGRLGERVGSYRLVRFGTALPVFGIALLAAGYALRPGDTSILFLATIPGWIGSGMSFPGAAANAVSVRPDLAGVASGLSGAFQLAAGALASYAVAHVLSFTAWPMIAMMAFTSVIAFAATFAAGTPPARRAPKPVAGTPGIDPL
jgi:DHA1 family bicyclomycin/chloramphenicol resistance-like MFS transporter